MLWFFFSGSYEWAVGWPKGGTKCGLPPRLSRGQALLYSLYMGRGGGIYPRFVPPPVAVLKCLEGVGDDFAVVSG